MLSIHFFFGLPLGRCPVFHIHVAASSMTLNPAISLMLLSLAHDASVKNHVWTHLMSRYAPAYRLRLVDFTSKSRL